MNLHQFQTEMTVKDDGMSSLLTQQSIPSPPCSIPDQQAAYNPQMMIGIPSPNTGYNNALLIDTRLEEQQRILNNNIHTCSGVEFNGYDAAAAVAAAEHHMMANMIQQEDNYMYNPTVDPKQFEGMSREQLIARLVALEKENHCITTTATTSTDEMADDSVDETATEEDEQELIRTCLWSDCGQKFDILQKLISHITEVHVGGGKATYRCEWQKCARNCEKKFSRPDSLTTHIKTHSNVRPFVCLFAGCGKAYYHSRSLKKHEKSHEPSPPPPSYEQVMSTGQVPVNNSFIEPYYSPQFAFHYPPPPPPFNPSHYPTSFMNSNM
ncbi:hypothetical protein INT47_012831 [Mucor saturninus]|uniref:C2H2-type domain-containing protein n=1 Tax=Mucor saturninus TaxID=64648 RepID=A0A8H7QXK8_9FUNG|nr:hypothetical protein INT47_012831 [Mucor saturninus]